jgi:hypothetical protein
MTSADIPKAFSYRGHGEHGGESVEAPDIAPLLMLNEETKVSALLRESNL